MRFEDALFQVICVSLVMRNWGAGATLAGCIVCRQAIVQLSEWYLVKYCNDPPPPLNAQESKWRHAVIMTAVSLLLGGALMLDGIARELDPCMIVAWAAATIAWLLVAFVWPTAEAFQQNKEA